MELVEGMQFDKGYVSPHFITDVEKTNAVMESPYVLLYDGKISSMKDDSTSVRSSISTK